MRVLNLFTYDYPFEGNDQNFIEDEIKMLSTLFDKINIIPLIKKKKFKENYIIKENIHYDLSLSDHLFELKNIFKISFRIAICKYFWLEFLNIRKKNFFKKIKMIIKERILAENSYLWILKNKNINLINDFFYSYWSNYTLLSFYLLKKEKKINYCFARSLGSDLNGFIPHDNFVTFINYKFKLLNFILILNNGQSKRLKDEKLIDNEKIIKCYQGIKVQDYEIKKKDTKKIHIVSCGRLVNVKNTIQIIKLIGFIGKFLNEYKIIYSCIGNGPELKRVKKSAKTNLRNIEFNLIDKVPSLYEFLKENDTDFYINLSLSEGMSFALMEAMSLSIPIICSNIPGNTEIVNNENGYVLSSYNNLDIEKIVKQIKIDLENNNIEIKRINTFKTVNEKINRRVVLENMKNLIKSKFF